MAQARKLGEILLEAGVVDSFQLRSALGEQQRWGGRLGITLIKLGFLEERDLVRALARQLRLPVAQLEGKHIPEEVLRRVPHAMAERLMCLPLFVREGEKRSTLFVGMEDPTDLQAIDELAFCTGLEVSPVLMAPSELCEGIDRFYRMLPALDAEPPVEPGAGDPSETGQEEHAAIDLEPEREVPLVTEAAGPSLSRRLDALVDLLVDRGVLSREDLDARLRAGRDLA